MAIAVGNSASANSKTLSLDNNKTSGENCVVVALTFIRRSGSSITGLTYGGVSMTQAANFDGGSGSLFTALYYLVDAPSGANNVVVSTTAGSNDNDLAQIATTLNGVDESSVLGTTTSYKVASSTTAISRTISTTAGSIVLDSVVLNGGGTVGAGQTEIADIANAGAFNCGSSYESASTTSTTMSWTATTASSLHMQAVAEFKEKPTAQTKNGIFIFS